MSPFRSPALDTFEVQYARYRTAAEGLAPLVPNFLEKLPIDPWSNPYLYAPTATSRPYSLRSAGPDSIPNTADDISADQMEPNPEQATPTIKEWTLGSEERPKEA